MGGIGQGLEMFNRAIGLRAYRQQVLASNAANADTPGYKARDFDFRAAMSGAVAASGGLGMAQTASGHLPGSAAAGGPALQYRKETQSAVDGNTVDMDVERAQIADNALQYEILTRLIGDHLQGLRAAMANN